ncbi:hypothetical protein SERLADRAFT_464891 [Serpula lacrymans var. lacrymans S7.9]|uniref:Xylanolytic transcriptional activator regulatory domain-containing protein n=1 Tax=Serpula lacrymans var. lacrymans (strain S7.9) TaxID=578457 RepID=F8NU89_SERL9|nr:uncharacterized protein SERLADRAFT_464891 [Serpula lacrymans var. lacrymans S7.9]EGO25163.1 hypothetical protein SERLADRAFT_464891 [Serpula lacrymans var. lacrymans S7.9]
MNKGLPVQHLSDRLPGSTPDPYKRLEGSISSTSNFSLPPTPYSATPSYPHPHPSFHRSSSYSPASSGYESENHARYQTYASEQRRTIPAHQRHSPSDSIVSSEDDSPYSNSSPGSTVYRASNHSTPINAHVPRRSLQLFDPAHLQCPHRNLMPHFIQLFFQHMGTQCTFIVHDEILEKFTNGSLTALLSSCIASIAVRFSNVPELTSRGLHSIAEAYGDNAKNILSAVVHQPSLDSLHALMVLAWSEYKNGRALGFRGYCEMAMTMAVDLGLSEAGAVNSYGTDQDHLRVTWSSLVQLHYYASSMNP